jgi:NADH:ubiquinone oxidoreductase subunit C
VADIVLAEKSAALAAIMSASVPGVSTTFVQNGELVALVARESLLEVMRFLRDDPRFLFEQLMDLCGVDWPERTERFDVVYNSSECLAQSSCAHHRHHRRDNSRAVRLWYLAGRHVVGT